MANVHYLRTTQVFPPIMQLFHFRRLLVTQISQDQKYILYAFKVHNEIKVQSGC